MPTWNVNLTDELDRFVDAKIERGHYETASGVAQDNPFDRLRGELKLPKRP